MKKAYGALLALIAVITVLLVQTGCATADAVSNGEGLGNIFSAASVDIFGEPEQTCKTISISLPRHAGYDVLIDKNAYASLDTSAQREAYANIETSIFSISDEWSDEYSGYVMQRASIPSSLSSAEIFFVKEAVLADHPEAFWITGDYDIGFNLHDGSYITLYSGYSYNEVVTNLLALERSIISIFKEIPSNRSEYERELAIHDILVRDIAYDTASVAYADDYIDAATVYGALVEGRALCTGYAQSFKLLCNRVGISCRTVNGTSKGEGHMWNLVRLDSYWYHVDVTWDDPLINGSASENCSYDYFNLTDEWIKADHEPAAGYDELERILAENPDYNETAFYNFPTPACTAVRYNYYQQNAVKIADLSNENAELVMEIIVQSRLNGESVLNFSFPKNMDSEIVLEWLIPVLLDGCDKANSVRTEEPLPLINSCERTVRDENTTPWEHIQTIRLVYDEPEQPLSFY